MHYIGLISGTSVDAIDAALVTIDDEASIAVVETLSHALPAELADEIHRLSEPGGSELDRAGALDVRLGKTFADAALAVLDKAGLPPRNVRAIGSHGQTVRHRPGGDAPFSIQLGNPAVIAERTGIDTVADFRSRDMAAGGEGAPLVPAFHLAAFSARDTSRVIVNIGGIANVTWLPTEGAGVVGFDTGPGNTLLDAWVRRHRGKAYDADGRWAKEGRPSQALLDRLMADPYFGRRPPKSTGREDFNPGWLEAALSHHDETLSAQDIQATLLQLTAHSIAEAITRECAGATEVYVCGGGARNGALLEALRRRLEPMAVDTTDTLGIDAEWVEAAAFAWLAHRWIEGLPGNLPSVTGASRPVVLGAVWPGRDTAPMEVETFEDGD
jgi:anhydro-N-acetylmuramic acid kinase